MWYEFTATFESQRELLPGEFSAIDAALSLRNSLNTMGIPVEHIDRMSLSYIRTEQESRLAHPSNNPLRKGNSDDR